MADALELDIKKTALVVIDLQKGIASRQTVPHPSGAVIANAAKLAAAFRARQMPVFLVHVDTQPAERLQTKSDEGWAAPAQTPPDWSQIVPELGPQASDILISKKQWGAFYGTDLELQLRRRGIDTIVLCGIATNYGVESTARFAYEFGFQQIFPEDAMSSMSEEAHRLSIAHVLRRIGRVR
ncbi:MAG: hydrolase, partial [Candidatus Micrarchaeota archaeon]|nr:hydrolase [Candidatus Micrarchaeota archaeon]